MALSRYDIDTRAKRLKLLLFDVDGVFTDGSVLLTDEGSEAKAFYIRDGAAVIWAQKAGLKIGMLSGRHSEATSRRAAELGISILSQGSSDKAGGYSRILEEQRLSDEHVGYMGDDLLDLPVIVRAGLSGAPADGAPEVRKAAHWVSQYGGGRGAVREFIEVVLRARGRWQPLVKSYLK